MSLTSLESTAKNADDFTPPENWYVYGEPGFNPQGYIHFFEDENWAARSRACYGSLLEKEKDLLTINNIARITDYREHTVMH